MLATNHYWFCDGSGQCFDTNEKCAESRTAPCVVRRDAWCSQLEVAATHKRAEACYGAMWQCADTVDTLVNTGRVTKLADCRGIETANGVSAPIATAPTQPAPSPPADVTSDRVRVEDGVKVLLVDHPFWCSKINEAGSFCASTIEICRSGLATMKGAEPCKEAKGAACYMETGVVTGQRRGWCFDKLSVCRAIRENDAKDPDERDVTECVVMRHEP